MALMGGEQPHTQPQIETQSEQNDAGLFNKIRDNKTVVGLVTGAAAVSAAVAFQFGRGEAQTEGTTVTTTVESSDGSRVITEEFIPDEDTVTPEATFSEEEPVGYSYYSPENNYSTPYESAIMGWGAQSENVNLGVSENPAALRYINEGLLPDISSRAELALNSNNIEYGEEASLSYIDNLVLLYERDNTIELIESPVVYGFRIASPEEDGGGVRWSRDANGAEHLSVVFRRGSDWEHFAIGGDGNMQWFTEDNAKIVGAFKYDRDEPVSVQGGELDPSSIKDENNDFLLDTESGTVAIPRSFEQYESTEEVWEKLHEETNGQIDPIMLTDLSRTIQR